ncbi:PREDICTED: iporin-like [Sturnus vulgaris]|uniref:iporin-like n=1 Tax=Sturnus vulgaris TaxID=9172 RepID=UPI00071A8546|nr:PREDICTED: iporin-like [Sturnus vulgaris]
MDQWMVWGSDAACAPIHHNSTICSEVKALCHHIATEAGQLSFNKGDILQVISKVDGDWLQCSLGSEKGLVPIMYVTHPEDEDY